MVETLKYLEAISVLEEISTEGHSPLKIITNDYCQYFIKNTRGRVPDYNIINEFLCHYLLKIWQIPTPDIAAIRVKPDMLPDYVSTNHKKFYYNNITFGSKSIPFSVEMNSFINAHGKVDIRKVANPDDIIKIGIFDIWVENTDRKPKNNNIFLVIRDKMLQIWALDNAFTFDSIDYLNLNPAYITNTYNENILYTEFAKSIIDIKSKEEGWIKSLEEYFYICAANCEQYFDEIVDNLPVELEFSEDLQKAVKGFIFSKSRNKLVFEEFLTRLKP